jgi:hypothetical protein
MGLLPLGLANKTVITTLFFKLQIWRKENDGRITKSYFILIICISIQRGLSSHGSSHSSSLPKKQAELSLGG